MTKLLADLISSLESGNIAINIDGLTNNEKSFIEDRDSFYLASIGEHGFPYIQHRGGPKG